MASIDIKLPEEWLKRLSTLGQRTDEIATKALEAGGEVVLKQVRNNLRNVIGKATYTFLITIIPLQRNSNPNTIVSSNGKMKNIIQMVFTFVNIFNEFR